MDTNSIPTELLNVLSALKSTVWELGPRLGTAALLLVVGVGVALVLRAVTRKVLESLDRIVPSRRLRASLRSIAFGHSAAHLLSTVVYWFVLLLFLAAATEAAGLPLLTTWLSGAAGYVPTVLSSILIVFAGLAGGVFVRDLVVTAASRVGIANATGLGRIMQTGLVLLAILVAVDQLGVDITTLTALIVTVVGIGLLGAALAFGLGARTEVGNILAAHYLQKSFRVGNRVRIAGEQGEIVQITPTAVILATDDGRAVIPARLFSEQASILIERS